MYDANFSEKILFNIRLKPGEKEMTIYDSTMDMIPEAFLVNANNKGYGRVVLDEGSI
jgi:hypothetical protein